MSKLTGYPLLLVVSLLIFVSCHKKYLEKSGTYYGFETITNANTTVSQNTYSLLYDKKAKSYILSSNTSSIPIKSIDRKDLNDGHWEVHGSKYHVGNIWGNDQWTETWDYSLDLNGDNLEFHYHYVGQSSSHAVDFVGNLVE